MNQVEPQDDVVLEHMGESEIVSHSIICRLCANPNDRIIGIYSEEGISNNLADKMNRYLPVQVSENDFLPLQCCWSCASTVLAWHELYLASAEADRRLREVQIVSVKQALADGDYCDSDDDQSLAEVQDDNTRFEEKYCADIKIPKEEEVKPPEGFTCSLCSLNFTSTKYLNIHEYKTHGIGKSNLSGVGCFTCDICKSTFKRRCDMLKHMRIQHAPTESKVGTKRRRVDINYKIFCDVCNLGFTRHVDMKKHKLKIHGKTNDGNDSNKIKGESLSCEVCQKDFKMRIELNRHLKKEHGQVVPRFRRSKSDIIAEHFCDVCEKGFTRKYDMQKHRTNKHPDEPKAQQEPTQQQKNLQLLNRCKVASGDNKNYYKCEVCSRIFRQSYNFMRHQSVHTGVRAFFCHICGKNFRVSSGLYRHITEHHYGIKKYDCDVCGRSFAAKATRDDHKNIHTDHRPFICDICGKAFRQKASLYIHKLFHSDNFRYSCNYCGKKYRRASELKIHTWLHTGHKPHQCGQCGARFRQRQDLKRHEKIHDKFSEHSCDDCGSTFSQKRFLKNHMKTHDLKECS